MVCVDTQRPALEDVAPNPQSAKGFWPPLEVFQDKTIFFLEENRERTQMFFSGVSPGDGIYARLKMVPIAGFALEDTGYDPRDLFGVEVLCGVLLRSPVERVGDPLKVELVGLKFKDFSYVDKEEESDPVLELVFEPSGRRSWYIPI